MMNKKLNQQTLALALTLTLCVTQAALPKTTAKNQKSIVTTLAENAQRYAVGQERQGMYLGASSAKKLGCIPGEFPDPIRGLTTGCTFHDLQKYGSMGRQIGTEGTNLIINLTWTNQDNDDTFGGRSARYDSYDPWCVLHCNLGGVDLSGGMILPDRSGFTVLTPVLNETIVNAHQWDRNFGLPDSKLVTWTTQNQTPSLGDFVGSKVDSAALAFAPDMLFDALIWPQLAVTETDSTPMVTHLLLSGQANNSEGSPTGPNIVAYIRKVGTVWQPVDTFFLAETYFRSPVITASRQSQRVAMAFSGGRGDGSEFGGPLLRNNGLPSGKNDNDLYLRISEDAGATWGPLTNITRRPNADPGGFAPHAKLSILFDETDVLHVAWQAISWPGYEGEFNTRSRMFHWDEANDAIRTAFDAVWDPILCNGGENTLNIDNPQLSACNGKLYLTFVQYAPVPSGRGDDCATRAFSGKETGSANGDIYVTVSSNGGFNWDPSRNLTNTYTPNCDTVPGGANPDCDSDVWHSATRYGVDVTGFDFDAIPDLTSNIDGSYAGSDYLFIQYINDGDAGAAVRGEGAWTNNAVKVIRFGCVNTIEPIACPSSSLPLGQAVSDPAHTLPGQDSTIVWTLSNFGNSDLTYSFEVITLSGPPGHTTVNGELSGGGTLSSGLINFVDLSVRLNSTLSSVVENAASMIILDGDQNTCFSLPDTFFIDYCICDLQDLKIDSLDNFMVLANNGNIGLGNNKMLGKLNFDFVGDPSECESNADSYLFDASPVISYNNGHVVTAMYSLSIVDSFQFRPQGEPQAETELLYEHASSGLFTTQDSALGLSVDYWTPSGNLPVAGTWKPVIMRVGYYNLTDAPLDSVFCAYALDWDVPSDFSVRNSSFIGSTSPAYIVQQGSQTGADPDNSLCRIDDTRYAATIYTSPADAGLAPYSDAGSGAMGVGFQALYTRDLASFVGNDWDHGALDSMLHDNFGLNTFSSPDPDSQFVDLHTMFNGGAYRIDPDDTLYLWLRLLTGFGAQTEFEAAASATIALAHPEGCCQTPGDANGSGALNIADITFLIARIFAGGAAPPCCEEADCNGDGKVNIADVTCFICRIFLPAEFCPTPVCGPVGMTCGN